MNDLRSRILEAGLATLREYGYAGFTQPRVAAKAGVRQSHLTYYYRTRSDLLLAVGRAAVERQRASVETIFANLKSPDQVARVIANLVTRHDNTRVLLALAQAGDEEPGMRELFQGLSAGIIAQVTGFLERASHVKDGFKMGRTIHALSVGLAVVDLATRRPKGKQYAAEILQFFLTAVLEHEVSESGIKPKRGPRVGKGTVTTRSSRPPRS